MKTPILCCCTDTGLEQHACSAPTFCAEWPRSSCEMIRIYLDRFNIDLRVWVQADEQAPLKPTRAGLVVSIKQLPALHQAIAEALAKARTAGLVPDENSSS